MKNKKYILSFLLFILLFGITYFYIFRKYDFNLLINTLKYCDILYIILGLISMMMYPVFEAIFIKRFFAQQFKRSCMPDGPKVGSVSLSPRGDFRMPSDASVSEWIKLLRII